MDALFDLIDNLTVEVRGKLMERLQAKSIGLKPFKKDKIVSLL
jgi:hypothetical protein